MRPIGNVHPSSCKRTALFISCDSQSDKPKAEKVEWIFSALKMSLNSADRRHFSLVLISGITKWPFFFASRDHGVSCTRFHPCWRVSVTHKQGSRFFWHVFVFLSLWAFVTVKLCGFIQSLLVFFLFFLFLMKLILFSYATMLLRSWREISCHLEASYLWQLLSNPLFQDPPPPPPPLTCIHFGIGADPSPDVWSLLDVRPFIFVLLCSQDMWCSALQNSPNFLLWKLSMGLNGIKSGI